jgi:hypothetical protein
MQNTIISLDNSLMTNVSCEKIKITLEKKKASGFFRKAKPLFYYWNDREIILYNISVKDVINRHVSPSRIIVHTKVIISPCL